MLFFVQPWGSDIQIHYIPWNYCGHFGRLQLFLYIYFIYYACLYLEWAFIIRWNSCMVLEILLDSHIKKVGHENNGQLEDCCIWDVNLIEYFLVLGLFTRLVIILYFWFASGNDSIIVGIIGILLNVGKICIDLSVLKCFDFQMKEYQRIVKLLAQHLSLFV